MDFAAQVQVPCKDPRWADAELRIAPHQLEAPLKARLFAGKLQLLTLVDRLDGALQRPMGPHQLAPSAEACMAFVRAEIRAWAECGSFSPFWDALTVITLRADPIVTELVALHEAWLGSESDSDSDNMQLTRDRGSMPLPPEKRALFLEEEARLMQFWRPDRFLLPPVTRGGDPVLTQ